MRRLMDRQEMEDYLFDNIIHSLFLGDRSNKENILDTAMELQKQYPLDYGYEMALLSDYENVPFLLEGEADVDLMEKVTEKNGVVVYRLNEEKSIPNEDNVLRALKTLRDNGVDADETPEVLMAICYTLLDKEFSNLIWKVYEDNEADIKKTKQEV